MQVENDSAAGQQVTAEAVFDTARVKWRATQSKAANTYIIEILI